MKQESEQNEPTQKRKIKHDPQSPKLLSYGIDSLGECLEKCYTRNQSFSSQSEQLYRRGDHGEIKSMRKSVDVCIEIGDGKIDTISLFPDSDFKNEAIKFCEKWKLEFDIVDLLSESLKEQFAREQKIQEEREQARNRLYRNNKNSRELWKKSSPERYPHPTLNPISAEIVKKIGKEKILKEIQRKSKEKLNGYKKMKLKNEEEEFEMCSFQPTINPISRQVDESVNGSRRNSRVKISKVGNEGESMDRFEYLYERYKEIEHKKEVQRRNSLMEIPFQPKINKVSKNIMEKKKSIGDICSMSGVKEKSKSKYFNLEQEKLEKEKSLKSRRKSISHLASNHCEHLYEEAKRRQEKIQRETERIYKTQENWRIIDSSNNLANNQRENRLRQIFKNLAKSHEILHFDEIYLERLTESERILLPLFEEMKESKESLTESEFVEAGLRLFKYITPNERSILMKKDYSIKENKENIPKNFEPTRRSKEILKSKEKDFKGKDIYMRGLIFKSEIRNQIEKGKEEKVRSELKNCTFKPKIHGIPHNF